MSKIRIKSLDGLAPAAAGANGEQGSAGIVSGELFGGPKDPIHARLHQMPRGATLDFGESAAGCLGFVWQGEITVGDASLKAGSAIVVEHKAASQVRSNADDTMLLVFNTAPIGAPPSRDGGHVHLLPAERVPRTDRVSAEANVGVAIFADADCPSCELWLHENQFHEPNQDVPLHYHTEDEIIVVTGGQIVLGQRSYGRGTAIAVGKDTVYGFRTGPEGLHFINFRPSHPTYASHDGSVIVDEQALYAGLLGRPNYLEAVPVHAHAG